jgi:hypothetical protein
MRGVSSIGEGDRNGEDDRAAGQVDILIEG